MPKQKTEWFGDEIFTRAEKSAQAGVDSIMADCVKDAKAKVPKDTTALQGSIQLRPAVKVGRAIVGLWGSFTIVYAAAVELGTGPRDIVPRNRKALFWPGARHPVKRVRHPGTRPRPYLRPAADTWYPRLASRIRSFFDG